MVRAGMNIKKMLRNVIHLCTDCTDCINKQYVHNSLLTIDTLV